MPQPFNNAVMTNAGARLLTRAQAGEIKIEFTRIAVGNGNYTAAEKCFHSEQRTDGKLCCYDEKRKITGIYLPAGEYFQENAFCNAGRRYKDHVRNFK